jgi:hypothetical protein
MDGRKSGSGRWRVLPRSRGGRPFLSVVGLVTMGLVGCGSGAEISVAGSSAASPAGAAATDLSSPSPVADHADPVVRAGAAGRQVACDGPVHLGGWAPDFGGSAAGAVDAAAAVDAFLAQGLFDLPATGYAPAGSADGRVLFTYEVDGAAKVAVIVADAGIHDHELTASEGWVVETFATCDPAEYGASADDELHATVWTDRHGERVPTSSVTSFPGHEHCGWQSVTFLHLGDRQYLRDPELLLTEQTGVSYDGDAELPGDAVDTGYRQGERELWMAADGTVAYVATDGGVEAWPATDQQVGCR